MKEPHFESDVHLAQVDKAEKIQNGETFSANCRIKQTTGETGWIFGVDIIIVSSPGRRPPHPPRYHRTGVRAPLLPMMGVSTGSRLRVLRRSSSTHRR